MPKIYGHNPPTISDWRSKKGVLESTLTRNIYSYKYYTGESWLKRGKNEKLEKFSKKKVGRKPKNMGKFPIPNKSRKNWEKSRENFENFQFSRGKNPESQKNSGKTGKNPVSRIKYRPKKMRKPEKIIPGKTRKKSRILTKTLLSNKN